MAGTKWAEVNSDYFDCIDNPEKAYILGLDRKLIVTPKCKE
uniref:Uncharacterized protein n=1 Tax=viral metagenome TaxID=1070528 RepID=A0A6M3MFG8_9ZZZZ